MAPWPGEILHVTGNAARYEDPPDVVGTGTGEWSGLPAGKHDSTIRGSVRFDDRDNAAVQL
ncbi:hypothetical protein, partial [Pseudomonas sp. GP01-A4]|uniref:hypothetical protein n=1 Tax=Pseudomonas sp. GP01-A4 TaxID=2070571 RepID=UPI001C4555F9